MKIGKTTLIPQNVAPENVKKAILFNAHGRKVCEVPLGHLAMPDLGSKLYSFLELSDCHVYGNSHENAALNKSYKSDTNTAEDLQRALAFSKENAAFTNICGDLTSWGNTNDLTMYKSIIDAYLTAGGKPVYAMAGNHEWWGKLYGEESDEFDIKSVISNYTGYPMQFVITHNDNPTIGENDVFIFCGMDSLSNDFSADSINWLYATLEENRNKRCFLHIHSFLNGAKYCGGIPGLVNSNGAINEPYLSVFLALLKHYKNTIYFHGHSHYMFQMQEEYVREFDKIENPPPLNYDFTSGVHSINVPSVAFPVDISKGDTAEIWSESQGLLVDVYENHIVLRGVDFIRNKFIPIATYCLDTMLKTIEAGTFEDGSGIITVT